MMTCLKHQKPAIMLACHHGQELRRLFFAPALSDISFKGLPRGPATGIGSLRRRP
jgi:hypothetical protein